MKQKLLVASLALMLVLCLTLGVTLAWLTAKTDSITNVFTAVGIKLTLAETPNTDPNDDPLVTGDEYWTAKMYPGSVYAKDPVVTVKSGSEACWVFVKIDDANNLFADDMNEDDEVNDKIIEWTIDTSNWTALEGVDGVYYKEVTNAVAEDIPLQVLAGEGDGDLADGKVTISNYLTNENMPEDINIVITAYAIQHEGFTTAAAAWEEAKELAN